MKISAIILTRNEENNIGLCLDCLAWVDEKVVVDANSSDKTQVLTEERGGKFIEHSFRNFASQRNFAMSLSQSDWILFVDADERVTAELAEEIKSVTKLPLAAYAIPRHNYFFGKRLRNSGSKEDAPVRLFPRGSGVWKQPVHEFYETTLPVKKMNAHLIHHTTRDLPHYMEKLNRYVPLEVETMLTQRRRIGWFDIVLRPPAKFLYLYFIRFGILDGWVGLQYAALSSYYDFKKYSLFLKQTQQGDVKR